MNAHDALFLPVAAMLHFTPPCVRRYCCFSCTFAAVVISFIYLLPVPCASLVSSPDRVLPCPLASIQGISLSVEHISNTLGYICYPVLYSRNLSNDIPLILPCLPLDTIERMGG
ncbi:hypothetical protein L227DRAFT_275573 [Lentinus tigrinus ALCF2SS1-6]|uniref:Uncharacterized protein n=1 Tax=Lentinus tigrinus ALCF2SS1-6 TaxID=1328759 RepID=A0A5C2SNY3_9APHY|nr:hypothetical protein L227DRAFT_275573 [Lentinus tigrinus ALCF2SS1-6]